MVADTTKPQSEDKSKQAVIQALLCQRQAYKLLLDGIEAQLRELGWIPREEKGRA